MIQNLEAGEDGTYAVWSAYARSGSEWVDMNKNQPVTLNDDLLHKISQANTETSLEDTIQANTDTQLAYTFEIKDGGSSNEKLKEIPKNSRKINLVCAKEPSK